MKKLEEFNEEARCILLRAHAAIHSNAKVLKIGNVISYPINYTPAGLRYIEMNTVSIGKLVKIMEQNKNKASQYAARARNGEDLSWVIPADGCEWTLIATPIAVLA